MNKPNDFGDVMDRKKRMKGIKKPKTSIGKVLEKVLAKAKK